LPAGNAGNRPPARALSGRRRHGATEPIAITLDGYGVFRNFASSPRDPSGRRRRRRSFVSGCQRNRPGTVVPAVSRDSIP
jgi:hypothetical protein